MVWAAEAVLAAAAREADAADATDLEYAKDAEDADAATSEAFLMVKPRDGHSSSVVSNGASTELTVGFKRYTNFPPLASISSSDRVTFHAHDPPVSEFALAISS